MGLLVLLFVRRCVLYTMHIIDVIKSLKNKLLDLDLLLIHPHHAWRCSEPQNWKRSVFCRTWSPKRTSEVCVRAESGIEDSFELVIAHKDSDDINSCIGLGGLYQGKHAVRHVDIKTF